MVTHDPLLPEASSIIAEGTAVAVRVLEPEATAVGDVVFCHGTPWSSRAWARVAREVNRHHRVFLWDMPGYGDSEKGAHVATGLPAQAARLASLLRTWGVRRPHVIAHDIGGAVALRAHLLHGIDFADLFLCDVVTLEPWGSPFFQLVAENTAVFAKLPAALHGALVREYIAGALTKELPRDDVDALAAPWLDDVGQAAFYRQIASLKPDDTRAVAAALGEVRCPVRIAWGRDDPWLPVQQAYELRAALPGHPDVVILDGVGHLAPLEDPGAVTRALRDWLAEDSPRPSA